MSFYSLPGWGGGAIGETQSESVLIKGFALAMPSIHLSFLVITGFPLYPKSFTGLLKKNAGLFFLAFYGFFTALWSPLPGHSLQRVFSFFIIVSSICSLVLLYTHFNKRNAWRVLLDHIQISFFLAHCIILYLAMSQPDIAFRYTQSRLGGILIHPNTLGAFCMISILINLFRLMCEKKKLLLSLVSLVLAMIVLIMSFSRSSIILTIFSVQLLVYLHLKSLDISRKAKILKNLAVGLAGLALLLVLSNKAYYIATLLSRGDSMENLMTASSRTLLWKIILDKLDYYLLIGHGYATLSGKGIVVVLGYFKTLHAHNGYVQLLAGTGLIGLSLFLYQLFLYLKFTLSLKTTSDRKYSILLFSLLIAFLLHNVIQSSIGYQIYPQFVFPVLLINLLWHYEYFPENPLSTKDIRKERKKYKP